MDGLFHPRGGRGAGMKAAVVGNVSVVKVDLVNEGDSLADCRALVAVSGLDPDDVEGVLGLGRVSDRIEGERNLLNVLTLGAGHILPSHANLSELLYSFILDCAVFTLSSSG